MWAWVDSRRGPELWWLAMILKDLSVAVPPTAVARRLGYRDCEQMAPPVRALFEELMAAAPALVEPRVVVREMELLREEPRRVVLGQGVLVIESRSLAARVHGCSQATAFAATIGAAVEDQVGAAIEIGEITRALVLDALGSMAADALAGAVQAHLALVAQARGLEATKRYSPGYGDWNVLDQSAFIAMVEGDQIGLRVNEFGQILPEKSVSGLVGFRRPRPR
jgi:hypothetical protein